MTAGQQHQQACTSHRHAGWLTPQCALTTATVYDCNGSKNRKQTMSTCQYNTTKCFHLFCHCCTLRLSLGCCTPAWVLHSARQALRPAASLTGASAWQCSWEQVQQTTSSRRRCLPQLRVQGSVFCRMPSHTLTQAPRNLSWTTGSGTGLRSNTWSALLA